MVELLRGFVNIIPVPDNSLPGSGYANTLLKTLMKLGYIPKTHSMATTEVLHFSAWTFQMDAFIPSSIA